MVWLTVFGVYSLWTIVFFHVDQFHQYLSPFYSPQVALGRTPVSPALFIFYIPLGFRATCYYYRKAYYRSFWLSPPACAVSDGHGSYSGETRFPLLLQNIHRYFLYAALLFLVFLAHDVWKALWFNGKFGIGVGTLVLLVNVILLGSYTLGCHSLRHLTGGIFDVLSRRPVRKKMYDCVSCMNRRHMLFAWMSLFWVAFSDLYVRMCSMGIWTDWRIL